MAKIRGNTKSKKETKEEEVRHELRMEDGRKRKGKGRERHGRVDKGKELKEGKRRGR